MDSAQGEILVYTHFSYLYFKGEKISIYSIFRKENLVYTHFSVGKLSRGKIQYVTPEPSQEREMSCIRVLGLSSLSLFLRCFYQILELFRQCCTFCVIPFINNIYFVDFFFNIAGINQPYEDAKCFFLFYLLRAFLKAIHYQRLKI